MSDHYDRYKAEKDERREQRRLALAAVNLDGPFEFPTGGDILGGLFGGYGARSSFAVCLCCGSMVVLDDPEEAADGRHYERGVRLHTAWHQEMDR